jgi:hypothetical protein
MKAGRGFSVASVKDEIKSKIKIKSKSKRKENSVSIAIATPKDSTTVYMRSPWGIFASPLHRGAFF